MKKKFSLVSLFLAALLFVTALAGCGESATEQTNNGGSTPATTATATTAEDTKPADVPSGEAITLTELIYLNQTYADAIKTAYGPFEQENNINMNMVIASLDQYDQKLSTMIAGNQAPDIFWCTEYSVPQWYEQGIMADLSSLMTDPEFDLADFAKGQQDHYLYDGKLIGVPFSGQPLVLFYNKDLFKKANLETPTDLFKAGKWTVDAMLDAARKIADPANGVFGISFNDSDWANWDTTLDSVLRFYGGAAWSNDYKTSTINSPEAVKGVEAYYDLLFKYNAHPKPGTTVDFPAGKLGMLTTWFGRNEKYKEAEFEWDVVPMPLNDKGESSGYGGCAGKAVYAKGAHIDLATKAIKHITSKEVMPTLTFVPPRLSGLNSETYRARSKEKVSDEAYNAVLNGDILAKIPVKQPHPRYAECTQVINKYLEAMYAQSMTPQQALDAMHAELQPLMVTK